MNHSKFYEAIEYYKTLVDRQVSDEYPSPTNESINIAIKAIQRFDVYDNFNPNPMILTDGIIGIFWKINNDYVSIDFHLDGIFTWGTIVNDICLTGYWNINEPIPQNIIDFIIN